MVVKLQQLYQENEQHTFQIWQERVATTYWDDATAIFYYALSYWLIKGVCKETLSWFHLAWSLIRLQGQSAPLGFNYFDSQVLTIRYMQETLEHMEDFGSIPLLLLALEQVVSFAATINLKQLHMVERFVFIFSPDTYGLLLSFIGYPLKNWEQAIKFMLIFSTQPSGFLGNRGL
jgi:hypothetical protein